MTISRMTKVDFGSVVLVSVPYVDSAGEPRAKRRPGVVISRETLHATGRCLVLGISSRPPGGQFEQVLPNWAEIGLARPSKVWATRPAPILLRDVHAVLGQIPAEQLLLMYHAFLSVL